MRKRYQSGYDDGFKDGEWAGRRDADPRVTAMVEWITWAWQYVEVTGGPKSRWEQGRALVAMKEKA